MRAPPELLDLQRFLAGAFRLERPIGEDAEVATTAARYVAGNDRLTPVEQADIYRRQFWLRHFDALAEDYPGLAALLGADAFDAFVTAYLTACPPRHPSLRDLGDRIVSFAEGYGGFEAEKRAAALEMVRYENAIVDVFDGAEPPPLDARKLAAMPADGWDRARIVLSPLLVRARLAYPVHTYRVEARAAADESEPAPPFPAPRPVCLALFRRELVVSFEELSPEAFTLLEALAEGAPLPRACERAAAGLDEAAAAALGAQVGAWFQQWAAWRWIVDVTLD
ncbi:MAG: DNA-binding domain-containing protein [Minicystis sp.]